MDNQLHQLHNRFQVRLLNINGRAKIPEWMCQHLKHPKDTRISWSFKGHEYQIQIAADTAVHTDVKKSSQVGVSQLAIGIALALPSIYQGENFIYVLPSTTFARKFVTSRVDPVIKGSEMLLGLLDKAADSTEMKQLGLSFLFFSGAQKAGQAISVPARGVVIDERDFASQQVLTTFRSRLSHTAPEDRINLSFSTPTVPGYGIDKVHDQGCGYVYMCLHEVCNHWTIVDPVFDIIVPGFDGTMLTFTKNDYHDPRVLVDRAWVRCQCCGREISRANLADPAKRIWVAKRPGMERHSYYVSPLDVAVSNSPSDIVSNVTSYERHDDFLNFGLGIASESAENSITKDAVDNSVQLRTVHPSKDCMYGTGMGMDVGKDSYITVMKPDSGRYRVLWAERVRQKIRVDGTDEVSETVSERIMQYGAARAVIDAAPDITIPAKVIAKSLYHQVWAAYFVPTVKGVDSWTLDEAQQYINIARTAMIDQFVQDYNAGKILIPMDSPETEQIKRHLRYMKRIHKVSPNTGVESAAWVTISDDNHWFFSMLYAYTACKLFDSGAAAVYPLASKLMTKVRVKGAA